MVIRNLSDKQKISFVNYLFLGLVIFVGGYLRMLMVSNSDFPINDGGLFAYMSEELLANNFKLPLFTSYNFSNIPFSYPPIGFYLISFIMKLTNLDAIIIIQYLPAAICIIAIISFYFFAKVFFDNGLLTFYATFAFALIPQNFIWQIMGGGVTRALGQLFSITGYVFIIYLFKTNNKKFIYWAALFTALTFLSHPDTAFSMVFSIILLFIFLGKSNKSFINLLLTGMLTVVITGPWWVFQLTKHQFEPLLSALKSGLYTIWFWIPLINFEFTLEFGLKIFSVLGVLGIVYLLIKKEYFLLIWLFTNFITQPRSGSRTAIIPFCLIVAYGIDKFLLPQIYKLDNGFNNSSQTLENEYSLIAEYFHGKYTKFIFVGILIYGIYAAVQSLYGALTPKLILSEQNRLAMGWVDDNLPVDMTTLVISDHGGWWVDIVGEWYPYLANRKSQSTVQGTEWLPNDQFDVSWENSISLRACIHKDINCLHKWQLNTGLKYSHVYLNFMVGNREDADYYESPLSLSLQDSDNYQEIYRDGEVIIFSFIP